MAFDFISKLSHIISNFLVPKTVTCDSFLYATQNVSLNLYQSLQHVFLLRHLLCLDRVLPLHSVGDIFSQT